MMLTSYAQKMRGLLLLATTLLAVADNNSTILADNSTILADNSTTSILVDNSNITVDNATTINAEDVSKGPANLLPSIRAGQGVNWDGVVDELEESGAIDTIEPEQFLFSTKLEDSSSKPVLVYAGAMFDIEPRDNIEISSIAFNTYVEAPLDIQLYVKNGSYRQSKAEVDIDEWTHVVDVTVDGQGMGNPTWLPAGSFEPILARKNRKMAIYITTDRPVIRLSKGDESVEDKLVANDDKILRIFEGVGKRYPIKGGTFWPRKFNGQIGYQIVEVPTPAPTEEPEWENSIEPRNPNQKYFNYDPNSRYGPKNWNRVTTDGYFERFRRLKTNVKKNVCLSGNRQSPQDLCATKNKCVEFHEMRARVGSYGLGTAEETWARPTPSIMHNKLRLAYKERRSLWESPWPPGVDFARNGFKTGHQDMIVTDFHVKSEHRLCGKQYDAEIQQYYVHKYGNLEAVAILVEANGKHNEHFQIALDFFQTKFDRDRWMCKQKQSRARALLDRKSKLRGQSPSSETAITVVEDEETPSFDEVVEASHTSSSTFEKIHNRFLELIHRETKEMKIWDPLEPGWMLRSIWFWGYNGSTTEPPCFERVKWRVVDVPMKISNAQYIQLKKLMFDHVDPDTCKKTSTHFEESNARPVQPNRGSGAYRCRRKDYTSDRERRASRRRGGFKDRANWRGVDLMPYIDPEFPTK